MNSLSSPSLLSLRILYAEDNDDDFFIFKYILKKIFCDIDIIHFNNGFDLIDYLSKTGKFLEREKENCQHMIFLDINMPKLDGFEILKLIKTHKKEDIKKLPIFMISTSSRTEDIQKSQNLGACGYVVKSAFFEDMRTSLSHLIQNALQNGDISWSTI